MKNNNLLLNGMLVIVLLPSVLTAASPLLAIPLTNVDDLATQSTSSAMPSSTNTSKQGRVEKIELKSLDQSAESPKQQDQVLKLNLKYVSDSVHRLQETLHNIVYEITKQQQVPIMQPNIVGSMVIPNVPGALIPIGDYLPPRQKYMTNFAAQVQTLLIKLIEEASTLPDNDAAGSNLNSQISRIKSALTDLRLQNESLQTVMAGPPYQNLAIGRAVIRMSDNLDQIKKLLKDAEHSVSKDIKKDPE